MIIGRFICAAEDRASFSLEYCKFLPSKRPMGGIHVPVMLIGHEQGAWYGMENRQPW